MGTWGLLQIVFDIFIALGLFIMAMRITRQPKDDPRLSRGLQLLQAKIAVLEDLSDRTESQVSQMTALMEQKTREVQNKIELADRHVQMVRSAMDRSLEVAKIFQDKIPHQEIIERKSTLKYLQAARLAHQGFSVAEISRQVELPEGEIEFIAKVNKDQLMFSEEQLPDWARSADPSLGSADPELPSTMPNFIENAESEEIDATPMTAEQLRQRTAIETVKRSQIENHQELLENLQAVQRELDETIYREASQTRDYSDVFNVPQPPTASLNKLGAEFRKACDESRAIEAAQEVDEDALPLLDLSFEDMQKIKSSVTSVVQKAAAVIAAPLVNQVAPKKTESVQAPTPARSVAPEARGRILNSKNIGEQTIRKVEFPKITTTDPKS